MSVCDLIRNTVLERIEDEIDLELYEKAMTEHIKDPQSITFTEMMEEINA